jgi:hypothetical protein
MSHDCLLDRVSGRMKDWPHQDNDANATATEDVIARAIEFLASVLKP